MECTKFADAGGVDRGDAQSRFLAKTPAADLAKPCKK